MAKPLLHNEDVISPPWANNISFSQTLKALGVLKVRVQYEATKQTNVYTPNLKFYRDLFDTVSGERKVTSCDILAERSKKRRAEKEFRVVGVGNE